MAAVNGPLSALLRPFLAFLCFLLIYGCSVSGDGYVGTAVSVVRREERTVIAETEYGEISAIEIGDVRRGIYHLQFITMEPNSLFLPVLLHADMVLYVHTGICLTLFAKL